MFYCSVLSVAGKLSLKKVFKRAREMAPLGNACFEMMRPGVQSPEPTPGCNPRTGQAETGGSLGLAG